MITLENLARQKQQINIDSLLQIEECAYDHTSQQTRRKFDREVFRISMKSDTAFDRESDPSDEK